MKKIKTISSYKELQGIINSKIADAEKFLIVDLNPNDPNLLDQLTLGDDWDNPFKLSQAMDSHSSLYARWATMLKILKQEHKRLIERKIAWESNIKKKIEVKLFKANKLKGMTANNAKPTGASIDYKFNSIYNSKNEIFNKYNDPILKLENEIDIINIIVKAFEQRKDMLVGLGHLLRSMLEKDLLIHKKFNHKKQR
jgi:hypothetical protein